MANGRGAEASELLRLIRWGEATTRAELQERLGLSRVTLGKRLEELMKVGLVDEAGQDSSTGGRPRTVFRVGPNSGLLLAAEIGSSRTRLGVTDFAGTVLTSHERPLDVTEGPGPVLHWIRGQLRRMLKRLKVEESKVLGIGVSVPGPVDPLSGRVVRPAIMPGWHGTDLTKSLSRAFGGSPIVVGGDAQVSALGEYRTHWADREGLVLVKVGEGIAAAAVLNGIVWRGDTGAAGDLGHLRIPEGQQCRCGRFGCLESVAGGWAMRKRLSEAGWDVDGTNSLVDLALRGDSLSVELMETAGRLVGRALGPVVAVLNPSGVVVAGSAARAGELLLAPMRAALESVCPDYIIHPLVVEQAGLGVDVGIVGAALLAQDLVTDPDHIESLVAHVGRATQ